MADPLSAANAVVRVNGQVLTAAKWNVDPSITPLDTSNFEGGGYEDCVAGLHRCEFEVEGWWDSDRNLHDSPLLITQGATLTNVRLYLNTTSGPYWYFPSALVIGTPITADVADLVRYRFRGKAKGTFTQPAGNA